MAPADTVKSDKLNPVPLTVGATEFPSKVQMPRLAGSELRLTGDPSDWRLDDVVVSPLSSVVSA
jgi:hypothetical protein